MHFGSLELKDIECTQMHSIKECKEDDYWMYGIVAGITLSYLFKAVIAQHALNIQNYVSFRAVSCIIN